MMREWCHLQTAWLTLRRWWRTGEVDATVSGHDFGEPETHTGVTVELLTCRRCGHVSIGWRR